MCVWALHFKYARFATVAGDIAIKAIGNEWMGKGNPQCDFEIFVTFMIVFTLFTSEYWLIPNTILHSSRLKWWSVSQYFSNNSLQLTTYGISVNMTNNI